MVIARAFLALLAGFALILALSTLFDALVKRLAPEWAAFAYRPPLGFVVADLGWLLLSGAAGGYLTAPLGADNPLYKALALAVIVLALGALSALQTRGRQPVWFSLTQVALSPLGVMAGALLRLRVLGVL